MRTSSGRESRPCTEPVQCKYCGADLLWATTSKNKKKIPVDATPDMRPPPNGGDIILTLRGGEFGELVSDKYWAKRDGERRNRYTFHKCPKRAQGES